MGPKGEGVAKTARAPKVKSDKPKRAPTAYIIFSTENREKVKSDNPTATFGELGKLLGAKWGTMTESDKAPYVKKSEAAKAALQA